MASYRYSRKLGPIFGETNAMFVAYNTMINSNERRLKYPNVSYMSAANYFSRCVINIFSFLPFVVQLQLKRY